MPKSLYRQDVHDELAGNLAAEGYKDTEIANEIGIPAGTFRSWRTNFPSFNAAIKLGRKVCAAEDGEACRVCGRPCHGDAYCGCQDVDRVINSGKFQVYFPDMEIEV